MPLANEEQAKKVQTRDHSGNDNGFLIELFKDSDTGQKTEVYLTAAIPGAFKGYHLHRVRAARYVALKGIMKITLYKPGEPNSKEEHILDANAEPPTRLFIPKDMNLASIDNKYEDLAPHSPLPYPQQSNIGIYKSRAPILLHYLATYGLCLQIGFPVPFLHNYEKQR